MIREKSLLVLASCDLIEPNSEWLKQLDEHRESVPGHGIAFRGERWEPMFALYHTDLRPLVQNQIKQRRYSMQRLLDSAEAYAIDLPIGLSSIPQANTPEQLEASRKRSVA